MCEHTTCTAFKILDKEIFVCILHAIAIRDWAQTQGIPFEKHSLSWEEHEEHIYCEYDL